MDFYVYLHKKKTNGEVFYVGKGRGNRAWVTSCRSDFWFKVYNKHGRDVELVSENLDEIAALSLEKELIAFYGRRDIGNGTLVNLCDGGKGTVNHIVTQEYRDNVSKRVSGKNHPRYDSTIWPFYNYQTDEVIYSTKYDFGVMFPTVSVGSLFYRRCTHKGWLIKEMFSESDLEDLKNRYRGNSNPSADKTEYEFINIFTFERMVGTRHDIMDRVKNFNASFLICGGIKVSMGWTLVDIFNSIPLATLRSPSSLCNNPKADKTNYDFINLKTREVFNGTRTQFKKIFGFSVRDLFCKEGNYSVKGWCLLSRLKEAELNAQRDYVIYKFVSKDGIEFVGTRGDFKSKFGFSIKPLFTKKPLKTCKGWSLSPQQPE